MRLIENIKDYFGKSILKNLLRQQQSRKVTFCNINNAKSVGVLCVVKDESDYKRLINFIKLLKGEYGIRIVKSLAFYNEKEEPFFLQSKLSFDYYLSTDINWKREPLKNVCSSFTEEKFDILIDLTEEFDISLRNLSLKSEAKFKVGRYNDENQIYYDFMINSEHANFSEFTKEVVRYLTIINEK